MPGLAAGWHQLRVEYFNYKGEGGEAPWCCHAMLCHALLRFAMLWKPATGGGATFRLLGRLGRCWSAARLQSAKFDAAEPGQ